MNEDERNLRKLSGRLVEQVSGLTSLVCSMQEQLHSIVSENILLKKQLSNLELGPGPPIILEQSVVNGSLPCLEPDGMDLGTSFCDAEYVSPPSDLGSVFISSSPDPMIYELSHDNQSVDETDFDEIFGSLSSSQSDASQQSLVPSIPRLNRRFNRRASGPLRILAVEDDPFCQQLIKHIVNSLNVGQIEVVADGVDAVLNMSTSTFDLILMDMQLPRLDGLQATQSIRKFNRRTPIVSMTGKVAAEDLQRYFDGGIDDVLPKPFDRQAVLRVIEQFFKLSIE